MENEIKLIKSCNFSISEEVLADFYLVIFKDLNNNYKVYFTQKECDDNLYLSSISENSLMLAYYNEKDNSYDSLYGEVDNAICLQDLIVTYGIISSEYNAETVNEIIGKFIDDYNTMKNKKSVKRLQLKREVKYEKSI